MVREPANRATVDLPEPDFTIDSGLNEEVSIMSSPDDASSHESNSQVSEGDEDNVY